MGCRRRTSTRTVAVMSKNNGRSKLLWEAEKDRLAVMAGTLPARETALIWISRAKDLVRQRDDAKREAAKAKNYQARFELKLERMRWNAGEQEALVTKLEGDLRDTREALDALVLAFPAKYGDEPELVRARELLAAA